MAAVNLEAGRRPGVLSPAIAVRVVPVLVLGMALSLFLAISYVICITSYLVLPGLPIKHNMLSIFLPAFELLNWQSFCLGLVESFACGWYGDRLGKYSGCFRFSNHHGNRSRVAWFRLPTAVRKGSEVDKSSH